ncbi:glycosyl transferase family protein [Sphingorhabdus sp.]|uniref:glycosyl transferase family protein n=1 Tax=Sphingorhabdus sp. TaxID=1902408 RepID=UPI00391D16F1
MSTEIFRILEIAQHELFLFSAIFLLIGALDELGVDLIWAVRRIYRRYYFYRTTPPLLARQLAVPRGHGLLAVFVPAWGEADVIGAMLSNCSRNWSGKDCRYRIYVGCYPNDPQSAEQVVEAARSNENIRLVLVNHNGPTTKADCLNRLWYALLSDEIAEGCKAKAIILHDAEDAVHADELHVFNCLVSKGGAVQLPVIPVRTRRSRWISGHYCDEFAEAHGKNLVVREALGAPLPLAGVACAIERNLMGRLAQTNGGKPFDQNSLTEDYELGIRIGAVGGRTIMARILDSQGQLVGTRACFPDTLSTSVRQKTRWLTGIALAGWDRIGWQGNFAQKWMLLQDRKSIFAAVILVAAYICLALTAILALTHMSGVYDPAPFSPLLISLFWLNFAFLMWRLAVRAGFVWALYGPKEALLSVPRSVVSNIIAVMAARRACANYVRHCFGAPLNWDKTAHHIMPDSVTPRD